MKFDELYSIIQEETLLEENFLNKLKCVLMAGALGLTSCDFESNEKINQIRRDNPSQYKSLDDDIERQVAFLSAERPEEIQELKNVVNQPDSVKKVKQIINQPKKDVKKQVLPLNTQKQSEFLINAKKYIEKNENHDLKIRNKWYKDNKGYPTIGIGHLVKKSDIAEGILKKGEYSLDKKGNIVSVYVSDKRAREIFNLDLNKKIASIKRQFPSYDRYPESVKIVLLDGFFRGDLAGSPTAKALIKTAMSLYFKGEKQKAQSYLNAAANEYLDSAEYRTSKTQKSGIYKRMDNNANILRNAFSNEKLTQLLTQNVYL